MARNLGMNPDTSLLVEVQAMTLARIAFYHLQLVIQLAPYLFTHDLATVTIQWSLPGWITVTCSILTYPFV